MTKKQQQQHKQKKEPLKGANGRTSIVYFIQSQSELSQNETNKRRQTQAMRRSLRRTLFRPEGWSKKEGILGQFLRHPLSSE